MILPLLAQVGPLVTPGAAPPILLPPVIDRPRKPHPIALPVITLPDHFQRCLNDASSDPSSAIADAEVWRDSVSGSAQVRPDQCLGVAHSSLLSWDKAEAAFLAGRDAAASSDNDLRARLGAMAGNAALAGGRAERALAILLTAQLDAHSGADAALVGGILTDQARALVMLGRNEDAAKALTLARAAPDNPEAWLLSATLARRLGRLAEAQTEIETAASLLPLDPEIGLEAGVIAVLSGRDDAARKSWRSVITAAPDSAAAVTAKAYLAQIAKP